MSTTKAKTYAQQFQEVFRGLALTHGSLSAWSDFVVMTAFHISNCVDALNRTHREEMHLIIRKRYTSDELQKFSRLFTITEAAFEEDPDQDFLGDIYTILELFNKGTGQFFTPYSIAKLMASALCGNLKEEIAAKGFITVGEPCCGAGALIIAFANIARAQGVDYQRDVIFVAQDIDFKVAMMCYIQLSLLGCSGRVIVGNSLLPDPPERENIWIMPMSIVPKIKEKKS